MFYKERNPFNAFVWTDDTHICFECNHCVYVNSTGLIFLFPLANEVKMYGDKKQHQTPQQFFVAQA